MNNTEYWDKRNNQIFSRVGHWQGGVDVNCQGHSLMNELMGKVSLMQLNILNATGKLVDRAVADWVELCVMGLSYPDSRIWCNQISAYAGDTDASVVAAASAAILSADSRAYGGSQARYISMSQQLQAFNDYAAGMSFSDILVKAKQKNGKPIIVGFARPIDKEDERLAPFADIQDRLNIPVGPYLAFAKALSQYLDEHFNLSMNCGGYASAFLLDQGFTPNEGYKINAFAVIGGAVACYRDMEEQSPNSFLPLKCTDIHYTGIAPRPIED
ncbi:hypothetical protein [Thalassomonas actiniarum]|uniref:Uncharacterized protein n=1 Tax=Thalassomonas actiniarum TaxID=485447 RepID=A0AAF0C5R1_9GAMM|nr:hypothetical protein [Thalassomonas actiniarum]WDE01170.1 hypothetical protein SG35_011330 [Thalassomonas actiniarum]